jgi:uncharacterized protein YggU (UPF0235/DUF167 family)/CheY-like chemotaxis protein
MRILLADDDKDQLELRSLLLSEDGHETIGATSAAAALTAARARKPECAVIDLRIPTEAMGLSLIRSLKELDAEMRLFVLTGGDPRRLNGLPEKKLVEEVIAKGSSTAYLMKKLDEVAGSSGSQLARWREAFAKDSVVIFDLKAITRAARSEIVGVTTDGLMKVRVAAVPDKGKANEEIRAVLAEWFHVPRTHVEVLLGETSQRKRVRVRK